MPTMESNQLFGVDAGIIIIVILICFVFDTLLVFKQYFHGKMNEIQSWLHKETGLVEM